MGAGAALRAQARVERDARKRVRLLAIANVEDGMPVEQAAQVTGMSRATLYRWIGRRRDGDETALADRPRSGRRPKVNDDQRQAVKAWVLAGPDVDKDGVVAWRGHDVQAFLQRQFQITLGLSSTYRLLADLGLSALMPRPRHTGGDPEAQEAFRKPSPSE